MNESDDNMLLVEKKDYIGFLTLNYPEKRNALSPEMLMDVYKTLETFSKKDDVRCLVVKGSGNKVFSSGYDISAIPVNSLPDTKQKTPDILLKVLDSIKNFAWHKLCTAKCYIKDEFISLNWLVGGVIRRKQMIAAFLDLMSDRWMYYLTCVL